MTSRRRRIPQLLWWLSATLGAVPAHGEIAGPRAYVYAIRRSLPPNATTPAPLVFRTTGSPREIYVDETENSQLYNGCLEVRRPGRYTLRLQASWPGTMYDPPSGPVLPVDARGACHLRIREGTGVVAEFRSPFLWSLPCTAQGVYTARYTQGALLCVDAWVSGNVGAMSDVLGNTVVIGEEERYFPFPFAHLSFLEEP